MITGYNHNVKYRDSIYHVQTEDSGLENPHIITHLFVGGNIIDTRKVSYAQLVGQAEAEAKIKNLMQEQHKAVLKSLIKGSLDGKIDERSAGASHLDGPAPLNVDAGQNRASLSFGGGAPKPVADTGLRKGPDRPPPLPVETGIARPPPIPQAQVDADADEPRMQSSFFGDAPPVDQFIEAETLQAAFDSQDESAVDSIFGEDLISEKSLDEVILSYLAEDMQK